LKATKSSLASSLTRFHLAARRQATRAAARLTRHLDHFLRDILPFLDHPDAERLIVLRHRRYTSQAYAEYERQMVKAVVWTRNRVMTLLGKRPVRLQEAKIPLLNLATVGLSLSVGTAKKWLSSLAYGVGGFFTTIASKLQPILDALKAHDPVKALEAALAKVRASLARLVQDTTARIGTETVVSLARLMGCRGFRVYSVLEPLTRTAHRARHLTEYVDDPKPYQRSLRECPFPPYESDGTLAHNCKCFLVPIWW
jgi:hypothetical protein